jgi:hypothetical protein
VVLLAADDLLEADFGSTEYEDARSFFCSGGHWRESRTLIAEQLELHVNDLERLGRARLFERPPPKRAPAPRPVPLIPPLTPAPTPTPPPPPTPTPAPPAKPAAKPVVEPPRRRPRKPREVHDRKWFIDQFLRKHG